MAASRKIGIFGGSFDPVHFGHLHLATAARDVLDLNQVRFLPCQISPHKMKNTLASGEQRCDMLRLATAELDWAVVDGRELQQAGPSYSYQTAETLAAEFPNDRLFWMMGGDQWEALPCWKSPERLAACVEFAVLARGDAPSARDGYRMHAVHGKHPASATAIREALANGMSPPWLHPAVLSYIREQEIYDSTSR